MEFIQVSFATIIPLGFILGTPSTIWFYVVSLILNNLVGIPSIIWIPSTGNG